MIFIKDLICSFTGHRPSKLTYLNNPKSKEYIKLRAALRKEIIDLISKGYTIFQTGMALGVDMLCAEIVSELREKYKNIKLKAIVPCLNQSSSWGEKEKQMYNRILDTCNITFILNKSNYFHGCMQLRNRYLVNTCDTLIAVYDGSNGGTGYTLKYAESKDKELIVIDPLKFVRIQLWYQENWNFAEQEHDSKNYNEELDF